MNFNLREISSKLSMRGWITVGVAALIGVAFIYVLLSLASSPSYSSIVAGQSPTQAGKVTSALSAAGIPYELLNGGTAVSVESSKVGQARDVLSEQGLLLGGSASGSLESYLGKTSLGADSLQQQEQDTSATEQQLDDTIESMNGINSAQVELSIPDASDSLFADTSTQASSSVLLNTNSNLGSSAVKAIAQLVSGAVSGLSQSRVTITDQDGDLLWPDASSTSGSSLTAAQTAANAYDTQKAEEADAYLASTIGANKALVQVAATLNTNKQTISSVTYAKKGTPLTQTTSSETLTGNGTTTTGTGNTATQLASVAGSANNNGTSKYKTSSRSVTLGVGKTVSQQQVTPGTVKKQTISVLVNSSVPASEVATIQSAVQNTVGFVAGRDQISVGTVQFPKVVAATAGSSSTKMLGDVKYVVIGLGALAFLFFMRRGLRRSENEQFAGSPTWLRELDAPRALSELEAQTQMVDLDGGDPVSVARLRSPVNVARQQVEELVDRDPERVASQIRQWMTED